MNRLTGFTLVETTLALALFGGLSVVLIGFGWNAIMIGEKTGTERTLSVEVQFVSDKLVYEIRRSTGVDRSSSRLGDASGKLVLRDVGTETTTFQVVDDVLVVSRGDGDPVPLTASPVVVRRLEFADIPAGDTEYVGFELELETEGSGGDRPSEYRGSVGIRNGAEIRSR